MGSAKKDLEIVYNLQWKNNPGHVNDKANIVAMCDIPATTLNWETFKSYLLKNSGATGDDVKVSYVSIDDKEFPIESQLDFQIALYSFRQRARQGGAITLKLECISNSTPNGSKRLRRMDDKSSIVPDTTIPTETEPPEWFKKYMKEFKKEIMDEVTESVVNAVSALKLNNRRAKFESFRRARRSSFCDLNDKEIIKSIKLEKEIDCKLEKLEQKTLKMKEKKMALMHNNVADKQTEPNFSQDADDMDRLVKVTIVGKHEVTVQHMWGGEVYQQQWEIINSGELEWNSHTELRYAWGSGQLKPVAKVVPCPKLKPQEKGTISVYLEMPKKPGQYECYWYFHHEGRRLSRWVGCHFSVDQSPMSILTKEVPSVDQYLLPMKCSPFYKETDLPERKIDNDILMNVNEDLENLKTESQGDSLAGCPSETQNQGDSLIGCPSETQSIISIAGSTSSVNSAPSDEFVVVRLPETDQNDTASSTNVCIPLTDIKVEKIVDAENVPIEKENDNNNNAENHTATNEPKSKYAYINYKGQKIAVPKSLLRTDYLENAEDAPDPTQEKLGTPLFEQTFYPSCKLATDNAAFCSTMTNSISENMTQSSLENKSRLFVFPLNRPGFEVVYPPPQPHSLPESVNLHCNEGCRSNQTSFVGNSSFDNGSAPSPCVGGARVSECTYSPKPYFISHPTSNFNHSMCGGQYCQQYANSLKPDTVESYHHYQPESPPPVTHHNIATAPPQPEANALHMFPDTLVSGAVNVASSAINTARSVLNMFTRPEQGKWINGHWVTTDSNSPREKALRMLYDMGFWDRDLNATLLARHNDDISRVISELLQ